MIDTHCHLAFPAFSDRIDNVLENARAAGVHSVITIATTSSGCADNLAIARAHEGVFCSAGVHPLYADPEEHPIDFSLLRAAGEDPLCVAWGELGLDKFHKKPAIEQQRVVLEEQLAHIESWTREGLAKPIILHCREAFDELIPILQATTLPPDRFVFHCFTGNTTDARNVLNFGAMLSFTGVVTYRNASEVADAAAFVPEDRIMVETDAPYLSPEPHRGEHPNEPKNVIHTANFIAKKRNTDPTTFEQILDQNAERFFSLT